MSMTASPNPATDLVTLRFTAPEMGYGTLRITNALGQQVQVLAMDFAKGENVYPLATSNWKEKGQFFASVEMAAGKATVAFVVQ